MLTATPRFLMDFLSRLKSLIPKLSPTPIIGPIKGDINIAPMTTAVEFTLSPMEAITILNMRIQSAKPLKSTSFLMPSIVFSGWAKSNKENRSFRKEAITELSCFQMFFKTPAAVLLAGAVSAA